MGSIRCKLIIIKIRLKLFKNIFFIYLPRTLVVLVVWGSKNKLRIENKSGLRRLNLIKKIKKCYHLNGNIRKKYFYVNNQVHREDGPAIICYYENGRLESEHYLLNNKYHRKNNPARIEYYKNENIKAEYYCQNNKLHRENGAAEIHYDKNNKIKELFYYLNGKQIVNDYYLKNNKSNL